MLYLYFIFLWKVIHKSVCITILIFKIKFSQITKELVNVEILCYSILLLLTSMAKKNEKYAVILKFKGSKIWSLSLQKVVHLERKKNLYGKLLMTCNFDMTMLRIIIKSVVFLMERYFYDCFLIFLLFCPLVFCCILIWVINTEYW